MGIITLQPIRVAGEVESFFEQVWAPTGAALRLSRSWRSPRGIRLRFFVLDPREKSIGRLRGVTTCSSFEVLLEEFSRRFT
ncbi:hypothetical protein [Infirmifilum sp. NZ]|uniref:hypothetical protein n=1 Tax=Infirmifilum sp. NZ TaxID=2926850 RepID=UPI0027A86047|nr:hypothetical protein [Infirmifilum sp. NZ]UNQ72793.1 hypothetical protein MOV14_06665 [Infirmifilum sp. NZ]